MSKLKFLLAFSLILIILLSGCQNECLVDSDCPEDKICVSGNCVIPTETEDVQLPISLGAAQEETFPFSGDYEGTEINCFLSDCPDPRYFYCENEMVYHYSVGGPSTGNAVQFEQNQRIVVTPGETYYIYAGWSGIPNVRIFAPECDKCKEKGLLDCPCDPPLECFADGCCHIFTEEHSGGYDDSVPVPGPIEYPTDFEGFTVAQCGNSVIEEGEQCEIDSDCDSGSYCSNCECVKACGDRNLDYARGEECDYGFEDQCGSDEACDYYTCKCVIACGDGDLDYARGEECEPGYEGSLIEELCGEGGSCNSYTCKCIRPQTTPITTSTSTSDSDVIPLGAATPTSGGWCVDGGTYPQCRSNSDCSGVKETCISGCCYDRCSDGVFACRSNSDCPNNGYCYDGCCGWMRQTQDWSSVESDFLSDSVNSLVTSSQRVLSDVGAGVNSLLGAENSSVDLVGVPGGIINSGENVLFVDVKNVPAQGMDVVLSVGGKDFTQNVSSDGRISVPFNVNLEEVGESINVQVFANDSSGNYIGGTGSDAYIETFTDVPDDWTDVLDGVGTEGVVSGSGDDYKPTGDVEKAEVKKVTIGESGESYDNMQEMLDKLKAKKDSEDDSQDDDESQQSVTGKLVLIK